MFPRTLIIWTVVISNFLTVISTQHLLLCESFNDIESDENDRNITEIKLRRVRALCDVLYPPSQSELNSDETDLIPDFDLTQIDSDADANQILKRFRRSRASSGGARFGGARFSSGSRSGSSSSRFGSSSSRSGSRIFGGSGSSSSGSSRIFSRSSSSSSSSRGGLFGTRSPSGSSSSGTSGHRVREAIRSVIHKPSSTGSGSSNTGSGHSVRQAVRSMFRRSSSGTPSGQITHSSGGGSTFGAGSSGFGGSSGTGGNVWVRAGKKFLPQAVRFGKRYYQRRKYSQGMYAGAGYYAGSRMGNRYGSQNHYGYPPAGENPPRQDNGQTATVFYCIQEDLNTTLVNKTLNDEGFGVCNISGELVTCPIEIECQTSEADNCCEDEQGTPFCCGGPIPEEYISQYGGYEDDDMYDAAESLNNMLNMMTVMSVLFATICFSMWYRRE